MGKQSLGREPIIGRGIFGQLIGEGFSAPGHYIDMRQCKCADNFAEEGGFLMIRFDEGQVNFGPPDFEGQTGEASSGAEVHH
jgi:hypothetical protein